MAARKSTPALPELTAKEVKEAKTACANYSRLYRAQKAAEKARDAALAQIFFKMGFSTLDEVKGLSPERLAAEIHKRAGRAFSFDAPAAREFAILKTWGGRFPNWKDQFLVRVGPAIAAEVENDARMQYSYAIIDPPAEQEQPNVIYLPKGAGK